MATKIRVLESSGGDTPTPTPIPTPSDMDTIASTAIYDKAKSCIAQLIEYYSGCGQTCCTINIKFPPGLKEELEADGYRVVERGDLRENIDSFVYSIYW
jgi:hypothetical protein